MTNASERQSGTARGTNRVCLTCGGRGALRQGDESYRTCLDCLGQGKLPQLASATTTAALLNKGSVLLEPANSRAVKDASPSVAK